MQLSRHEIDNFVQWNPASPRGHYESFFLKANDPASRRAVWLKFTILSPIDQPDHAVSEVWAIAFDGETDHHVAVKRRQPVERSKLGFNRFGVQMAGCELAPARTSGVIERGEHRIEWDLTFLTEQQESLHPFPFEKMYEIGFPKAKLKTPYPDSRFCGTVRVDGVEWGLDYWKGMQGHNWGVRHTDHYLWLHCNAFDGLDDTYLEGASAKLKLGPVQTPYLTFFCLVHQGQRIDFNQLGRLIVNKADFRYFEWRFEATAGDYRLEGKVWADPKDFVGLHYENPDGSLVDCLNSKIAHCRALLYHRSDGVFRAVRDLVSDRVAFEVLTDAPDHGIPIAV